MRLHDNDDDAEEDNMPLSSRIKAFRRGYAVDEDDVVLSLKYQAPQQGLINVDADLEVVCANTAEMEVDTVDDDELFGIDDVDAFFEIAVQKNVDNIFEDIFEKVDMDLAKEVVRELEGEKQAAAAEPKTYRRRRRTTKRSTPQRRLITSKSKEEVDDEFATPQDNVVLTTFRDIDGETTGMEIAVFRAPHSASREQSTSAPIHSASSSYVDKSAHIKQAVKCLLLAIEEQSKGMKNLLKHLDHKDFLDGKAKVLVFQGVEELTDSMDALIKIVVDFLKLIGTTVQSFSNDVVKKLNCISIENQSSSKIIEHKIMLFENHLVHMMEQKFE
ncbi:hypothetical protein Dimus_022508 [Dionaea muscipula]